VTPRIEAALRDTQAIVGWEFHEDEYHWPFLFGGWLPMIKEGLDHSITWYDGDLRAQAGYWATQLRLKPKGSLNSTATMALSRKIGLRLVAEPDQIPNWVDLIPLLGTRRTMKRHYRRAQTDHKSIFKEYLLLQKLRRLRYDEIMQGKKDFPSPMDKWLSRHPKSVWLPNFPGMEWEEPVSRVISPRYGFSDQSFEMKLCMMKKQGYIDCITTSMKVHKQSQIDLAEKGILDSCDYRYLPVGESGLSTELLKTFYPGFLPWYEEYGHAPTSLWEGDEPFGVTRLWPWLPSSSLITLIRTFKIVSRFVEKPIQTKQLHQMAIVVLGAARQLHQPLDLEDDEQIENAKSERSLIIENLVRDVIRDWFPDADERIEQMRSRIVPAPESQRPQDYDYLVSQHTVLDPFTLTVTSGAKETLDDTLDDEDEVYDPWSELGV
jgi:hypothetical protein